MLDGAGGPQAELELDVFPGRSGTLRRGFRWALGVAGSALTHVPVAAGGEWQEALERGVALGAQGTDPERDPPEGLPSGGGSGDGGEKRQLTSGQ